MGPRCVITYKYHMDFSQEAMWGEILSLKANCTHVVDALDLHGVYLFSTVSSWMFSLSAFSLRPDIFIKEIKCYYLGNILAFEGEKSKRTWMRVQVKSLSWSFMPAGQLSIKENILLK